MKKPEFPKVLKLEQTKTTFYKTPSHGCTSFTVVWYEGAVRKRKSFGDIVAAEVHANGIVESMSKGETQILNLSGEERLFYTRIRPLAKLFLRHNSGNGSPGVGFSRFAQRGWPGTSVSLPIVRSLARPAF